MRSSIAVVAVAAAAAFSTSASAQSRYGPPPSGAMQNAGGAAQDAAAPIPAPIPTPERLLTWRGKVEPKAETQQPQPAAPIRPEPLTPLAQRLAAATPPPAVLPPAPALPTSLYEAPRPIPAPAPAAPQPQASQPQASVARTPLLGGPQAPAPAPAPQAAAAPAPQAAASGPRFYSVYREYGLRPDAIPVAPQTHGQETTLREAPSTPSLAAQDDTQYLPARPLPNQQAPAAATTKRTF